MTGRVALAACTGGALAVAALAGAVATAALVPCRAQGLGCLGYLLLAIAGALSVAAIAAWPILHALKVRPALPVAVLGPSTALAIGWFCAKTRGGGGFAASGVLLEAALGYGIAAFATAGAVHWWWRVAAVAAVAALVPLAGWIGTHRADRAYDREITGAGVPLLAPDLPGYAIENAHADPYARTLGYELTPRSLPTTAPDYERAGRTITVLVTPVPARFAPPARCNFSDAYRPDQPCAAAGPELWRRTTAGPEVDYLTRRGTVLVNVSQGGDLIDEPLLRRVVTGLSPRPAADFRPR